MKRNVKLSVVAVTACLCAALGCMGMTACSSTVAGESPDAPPVTGKGHEGRFETLGAAGCYGCHGYNSTNGKSQLKQATVIPLDHTNMTSLSDLSEVTISSDHAMCQTCHVYGS